MSDNPYQSPESTDSAVDVETKTKLFGLKGSAVNTLAMWSLVPMPFVVMFELPNGNWWTVFAIIAANLSITLILFFVSYCLVPSVDGGSVER